MYHAAHTGRVQVTTLNLSTHRQSKPSRSRDFASSQIPDLTHADRRRIAATSRKLERQTVEPIDERELKDAFAAGNVVRVIAYEVDGGFLLVVRPRLADQERVLTSTRKGARVFASLNTMIDYLRRIGMTHDHLTVALATQRTLVKG